MRAAPAEWRRSDVGARVALPRPRSVGAHECRARAATGRGSSLWAGRYVVSATRSVSGALRRDGQSAYLANGLCATAVEPVALRCCLTYRSLGHGLLGPWHRAD